MHAVRISQYLADVAQVIVEHVFALACQQLVERFPAIQTIKSQFAIVAYGKLGSKELNYISDLDLVFLHSASPEQESLVTRLTQKIVHMLTTRSRAGVLFAVDTRLRPSGSAGLLVSHIHSFLQYQQKQAWTWEHQALLKARVITGTARMRRLLIKLKKTIMLQQCDPKILAQEVLSMREKIAEHQNKNIDIKHHAGGLLDIEFLVQYLVLKAQKPVLADQTNTLIHLKKLTALGNLSVAHYKLLQLTYRHYHQSLHQQLLGQKVDLNEDLFKKIAQLCQSAYD